MVSYLIISAIVIGLFVLVRILSFHSSDHIMTIMVGVLTLFATLYILMTFTILLNRAFSLNKLEKLERKRESIVCQINEMDYSNKLSKEYLYKEITDFNKDVSKGKELAYSPWFAWAVSDAYYYVDLIEYPNQEE